MTNTLVDGMQYGNFKDGAIIALLAIVMVFVVLIVIIVLTDLISKFVGKDDEPVVENQGQSSTTNHSLSNIDDDAMVACLVASIDYRNETKKHIQVLSVKEG